jgi:hypothetical protein
MTRTTTDDSGDRNLLAGILALLAVGLLVAAAAGSYRAFSYLAVGFVVAVIGASSIERNASELDLAPYGRLVGGLAIVGAVGFTGIWLLWNPSVTSYTYTLGLPQSTLVYFVFLWLLPIGGAFYYAFVFPSVGSEEVVDDLVSDAFAAQRRKSSELPLASAENRETVGVDVDDDEGDGAVVGDGGDPADDGRRTGEVSGDE